LTFEELKLKVIKELVAEINEIRYFM